MSADANAGPPFAYALLLALVASLGGFLFGFDSGVINGTVKALQLAFHSDSLGTGFSVASMLLGCAVGALIAGTLADQWGRKPVMLVTALLFMLSAWGSGIADSSLEFIVYRVLGGVAVGAASLISPTYIAEIAPPAIRGRLGSLQQLAIVIGLVTAFISNYLIAGGAGGAQGLVQLSAIDAQAWRWMFWVELLPALLFFMGVMSIPDSPRYWVARGKREQGKGVLSKLGAVDLGAMLKAIEQSLSDHQGSRWQALRLPGRYQLHPWVWIGITLAMLQQLVGINVIFYYGAELWRAAGFSEHDALWTNVVSGSVNTVSTLIAMAFIDSLGRRKLLLIGSVGMFFSLSGVALGFYLRANVWGIRAALGFANLYVVFFAATWGPVLWVLLSELFPNHIRGAAMAIALGFHWLANFAVTMTFPWLLKSLGLTVAYGIYASFALLSFVFVRRFVRETRGIELEALSNVMSYERVNK